MPWREPQTYRLHRLFLEAFSAIDVAEKIL
jgi:hypothetical protein